MILQHVLITLVCCVLQQTTSSTATVTSTITANATTKIAQGNTSTTTDLPKISSTSSNVYITQSTDLPTTPTTLMSTISTTPVPSSTNTTVASTSSTISLIPSASSIEAATITKSKQYATTESTTPVITSTSTQFQTSTSTPATESTASTQTTSPKSSSSGATEQTTTSSTTTEGSTVITEATTTTQTTLPTSSSSRSTVNKSSGGAEPCIKDEASEHCYQIVDTYIPWIQAFRICRGDGGDLVIIESFEEQQFIAAQILKRTFAARGLWMGSDNARPEKQPTWFNGENFSYTNWAEGEPNNPWVDENCVVINIGTKAWHDYKCTYLHGYICEYTPTYGINKENNCNRLCYKGETELCIKDETTGHCYQIVDNATTWTNAFRICKQANGMLVVIESAQEQQFIEHQMQKISFTVHALWMGSNTLHPEAQRKWTNGKKFNYVNWEEGQPNNYPYVETCAEIYTGDGKWNNYGCRYGRGYICEKTSPGKPNTSQTLVFVIGVAAGTPLVLLAGILLLYCIIQKRKKHKEKRDEAYEEGHNIRMNNIENVYNQVVNPTETYCTIDDLSEQNQMH